MWRTGGIRAQRPARTSLPHATFDKPAPQQDERRAVIVPVATLGAAALHAVRYVPLLRARERVAVHVDTDPDATRQLALDWMDAGLAAELRLEIVDSIGNVADTLAAAAADRLNRGVSEVVVLATRQTSKSLLGRARRDHTGVAIYQEVSRVCGATTVLLDVPRTTRRNMRRLG